MAWLNPQNLIFIGVFITVIGVLISGIGAFWNSNQEDRFKNTVISLQTQLTAKADSQAESQRLLSVKSDEIAHLNREIADNQIKLREKSEEIASLSKESLNSITGGDSYCYLTYLKPCAGNIARLILVQQGKYPLFDVNIRIADISDHKVVTYDDIRKNKFITLPSVIPGFATDVSEQLMLPNSGEMELNVFITARNGYWIQNIKLKKINGEWKERSRLVKQINLNDKKVEHERNDF